MVCKYHQSFYSDGQYELDTQKVVEKNTKKLEWSNIDFLQTNKTLSYYEIQQDIRGITNGGTITKMVLIPDTKYRFLQLY